MTANLGWISLTTSQSNKEGTINTDFSQVDAALTDELSIDALSGTAAYTLSLAQTRNFFHFQFTPNGGSPPTAGQLKTLALGAVVKTILISNLCLCDLTANISGGDTVFIAPNSNALLYLDGTSIRVIASGGGQVDIQRVRLATAVNRTIATDLNSGDTIDGVVLTAATDEHVLLFGQTTGSQNGPYKTGVTPARSNFAAVTGQIRPNTLYVCTEGQYSGAFFYCTNTTTPTIGVTAITFSRLNATTPYLIGFHFPGTPTVSSLIWRHVCTEIGFSLADELLGSVGRVTTNPSAATAFDVKKNGSSIGTITVSTGGVFTFTTSGASAIAFVASDYLDVVAPGALNALSDLSVTFKGFR